MATAELSPSGQLPELACRWQDLVSAAACVFPPAPRLLLPAQKTSAESACICMAKNVQLPIEHMECGLRDTYGMSVFL